MFGFGKRKSETARGPGEATRDEALAATIQALQEAGVLLTHELRAIGADCAHLAGSGARPTTSIATRLRQALLCRDDGRPASLRLCKIVDDDRYDFRPHLRYREIHLLVEDIERTQDDQEERQRLVRQHGVHGLVQIRLMTTFLSDVGRAERLMKAGRAHRVDGFLDDQIRALVRFVKLPAALGVSLDQQAVLREWLGFPGVLVRPEDGGLASRCY